MKDFFRRVHKAMNVIQPLVFVFVALVIVFTLRSHVAADLSKYGGSFMKKLKHTR